MLLILLLACAPQPEDYAGCVVTAVSSTPDGMTGDDYERVTTYDALGRVVAERWVYPDGSDGEAEYRYEGECVVRQRGRSEGGDERRVGLTTSECDEHGHLERQEREHWVEDNGEVLASNGVLTYANAHDEQGRLTAVTPSYGDQTTTYEWAGACNDPVVTTTVSGDVEIVETVRCRADGQPYEVEAHGTDRGVTLGELWTRYAYDVAGRLVAEEHDEGPYTAISSRTTWSYGDDAAPGPTEEVKSYHGEVWQTVRYTYDCP